MAIETGASWDEVGEALRLDPRAARSAYGGAGG